jgi:hypothetical protein
MMNEPLPARLRGQVGEWFSEMTRLADLVVSAKEANLL